MKLGDPVWILINKEGRVLQETLGRTRSLSWTAGADLLSCSVENLKAFGVKAIKIELVEYKALRQYLKLETEREN